MLQNVYEQNKNKYQIEIQMVAAKGVIAHHILSSLLGWWNEITFSIGLFSIKRKKGYSTPHWIFRHLWYVGSLLYRSLSVCTCVFVCGSSIIDYQPENNIEFTMCANSVKFLIKTPFPIQRQIISQSDWFQISNKFTCFENNKNSLNANKFLRIHFQLNWDIC